MPRPVRPSRITTIGFRAPSSAFTCRTPRQSARRPLSELALPRSTAKSVRFTATLAASASGSSIAVAEATTSDAAAGPASGPLPSALASSLASTLASAAFMSEGFAASTSLGAAGSGGPMIDLVISEAAAAGEAGPDAGLDPGPGEAVAVVAVAAAPDASGFASILPASARGLSGPAAAAAVLATGARTGAGTG